jgi:predicted O-methyltransferase YrrM
LKSENVQVLTATISLVVDKSHEEISGYMDEILSNRELSSKISDFFKNDVNMRDSQLGWGRRIGWYAIIRAVKPSLVVETGVHHGIGAAIIAEALSLNISEGFDGSYLGTDHDPNAGSFFAKHYSSVGRVMYGDSIESLSTINGPIDIFINDSDHSALYELNEYENVAKKLSRKSIILGDNSHVTTSLLNFSVANSRKFLYFQESPAGHWYPGGGIGISFT